MGLVAEVLIVDADGSDVVNDVQSVSAVVEPTGGEVGNPASSEFAEHALTSPTTQHAAISRLTVRMTT